MPQFQLKVDLGHILSICVMLVAMGVAWGSLDALRARQSDMFDEQKREGTKIGEIRDKQLEMDGRLKNVEQRLEDHIRSMPQH